MRRHLGPVLDVQLGGVRVDFGLELCLRALLWLGGGLLLVVRQSLLEQAGDVFNARRVVSNLTAEIATPGTLGDGSAARIMQVTPLTFVSTDAVIQAVQPLLEPNGDVSQLGNSNMLIISGSEYDLQRVNQLLTKLYASVILGRERAQILYEQLSEWRFFHEVTENLNHTGLLAGRASQIKSLKWWPGTSRQRCFYSGVGMRKKRKV